MLLLGSKQVVIAPPLSSADDECRTVNDSALRKTCARYSPRAQGLRERPASMDPDSRQSA